MRILAVRGANIASLESFAVEFREEPLRSAGIFAIVGPTGAGKSTLLDALCLALYHQAPRLEDVSSQEAKVGGAFGEIGQNDIRNLVRRGCSTGWAECEFRGVDGGEYRARWGWRSGRRAGSASQEEVSLVRLSDGQVLETRKERCAAAVLARTGLTFGQFTRTVLLAQGRFAEFLKAREGERAELLEKLTGTEIYSRISRAAYERRIREEGSRRDLEARLGALRILPAEEREAGERRLAELSAKLPELEGRGKDLRDLGAVADQWRKAVEELGLLEMETESVNSAASLARDAEAAARGEMDVFLDGREAREAELDRAVSLDAALGEQEKTLEVAAMRSETVRDSLAALEEELGRLAGRAKASSAEAAELAGWLGGPIAAKLAPVALAWDRCRDLLERARRLRGEREASEADIRSLGKRIEEMVPGHEALLGGVHDLEKDLVGFDPVSSAGERAAASSRIEDLARARRVLGLAARMSRLDSLQGSLRVRKEQLDAMRPRLAGELDATRRLEEDLRVSVSENVEHLREALVEGSECPVCGSREHPRGRGAGTALREALETLRSRRRKLEEEVSAVDAELAGKEAEGGQVSRERAELDRERAGTQLPADLAALLESGDPGIEETLSVREEECRARIARSDRSLAHWQRLVEARQELSGRAASLAGLRQRLEAAEEGRGRSASEFDEVAGRLDGLFGAPAWRANWEPDPVRFSEGLEPKVAEYLARARRRDELEAERGRIAPLLESVESRIPQARDEAETALRAASEAKARLVSLQEERGGVLGGAEVAGVRDRLRARESGLAKVLEACGREASAKSARREAHEALLRERRAREGELSLRIAREGRTILGPGFGDSTVEELVSTIEGALREAERELGELRSEIAAVAALLDADRQEAERAAGLRVELERGAEELRRWAALSDAIGSADGKLFRVVAQRHTLEILLEEANRELERITPRYRLRPLPGTMHFGVVDADSFGELRPVHTLSGGETFVVSLALALGLSRMAGGAVRVESLFVDEGFGALDPASLRSVMSALSHLHAQGRQVGVVTHVEEMKDQIPVRIEVSRTGPGRSTVAVRG